MQASPHGLLPAAQTHWPPSQVAPLGHSPHVPPQPLSPQILLSQVVGQHGTPHVRFA
jgi:hypothetical protein